MITFSVLVKDAEDKKKDYFEQVLCETFYNPYLSDIGVGEKTETSTVVSGNVTARIT